MRFPWEQILVVPSVCRQLSLRKKHLVRAEESCGNDVHWSVLAIVLHEQAGLSLFDLGTSHRRRRDLTL